MTKKFTAQEFILKAEAKHQDDNGIPLYDYSEVDYKTTKLPVWITHISCGNRFQIIPNAHLTGNGCNNPNCIELKKIKTSLVHFGTNHPHQSKVIKESKIKNNLRNFGVENPSQCQKIKDKKIKTSLTNFGTRYPMQCSRIKDKCHKTNEMIYGFKNPRKNENVKFKIKTTNEQNHGGVHSSQHEIRDILKFIDDPEWMYEQYTIQYKTAQIISNELSEVNYISTNAILRYLKKHNIERREPSVGFSLTSCNVMDRLSLELDIQIQHALNGKEFKIPGTRYSFDGYCKELNLGIEYNGSHTHGNLRKYQPEYQCHPYTNQTAQELQEKDKVRLDKIRSLGYNVFVVWDDEWQQNKEEVIMRLKAFIEEIKSAN